MLTKLKPTKKAHNKLRACFVLSAESEGFEPPDLLQSTVFKTAAFDHSASSPGAKVQTLINFTNFDLKNIK